MFVFKERIVGHRFWSKLKKEHDVNPHYEDKDNGQNTWALVSLLIRTVTVPGDTQLLNYPILEPQLISLTLVELLNI